MKRQNLHSQRFKNADLIQPPEHPVTQYTQSHNVLPVRLSDFKRHLLKLFQKTKGIRQRLKKTPTLDSFSLPRCVHRAPWLQCATAETCGLKKNPSVRLPCGPIIQACHGTLQENGGKYNAGTRRISHYR